MKQKYILYDNINNYEMQDEIRRELFQEYAEEQLWLTSADVPDSMVDDEIAFRDGLDWIDLKSRL